MAIITDITEQVKDKRRCNIYLDSRFCCGLKLETVMSHRLRVGQEITTEQLGEIQRDSEKSDALDKALEYISASMKTEKQIRDYLKRKGYLPESEDYAVEKMKEYGYIDDISYGERYAASLSKSMGKRLIEQKLMQKGVSASAAAQAAGEVEGEEEAAKRTFEKYMRAKEYTKENLRKAYRYLSGRGFSHDTISAVIKSVGEVDEDI